MKIDDRFTAGIFVGLMILCSFGYLLFKSHILTTMGLGFGIGMALKIYFDERLKQ